VVLFDEIEKAHSDVFNMLLQIMEEGRLTDSFGRQHRLQERDPDHDVEHRRRPAEERLAAGLRRQAIGRRDLPGMKELLSKEVEKHFRPEFLNRLDDLIVFRPLQPDGPRVDHPPGDEGGRGARRQEGRADHADREALGYLIDQGFNPDFGARPLKRAIERLVEDPLSEGLLRGEFKEPSTSTSA
jgi:ATP-dependent Clp protease ATP-binding subunit ClpC